MFFTRKWSAISGLILCLFELVLAPTAGLALFHAPCAAAELFLDLVNSAANRLSRVLWSEGLWV